MKPSLWDQTRAFGRGFLDTWVASMSGLFGLFFTILTFVSPEKWVQLIFGILSATAALFAAFFVWREQYLTAHDLREAGRPRLKLVFDTGGSFYYETEGRNPSGAAYLQRLFRVGIINMGRERCLASVSIKNCVPPIKGLLTDHRLRFMARSDANKMPIGTDYIDPADEPTAYVDFVAEHKYPLIEGGYFALQYENWGTEFFDVPESFILTLRLDGGPQSTTYDFHCSTASGVLVVNQIPDVPLLQ